MIPLQLASITTVVSRMIQGGIELLQSVIAHFTVLTIFCSCSLIPPDAPAGDTPEKFMSEP